MVDSTNVSKNITIHLKFYARLLKATRHFFFENILVLELYHGGLNIEEQKFSIYHHF